MEEAQLIVCIVLFRQGHGKVKAIHELNIRPITLPLTSLTWNFELCCHELVIGLGAPAAVQVRTCSKAYVPPHTVPIWSLHTPRAIRTCVLLMQMLYIQQKSRHSPKRTLVSTDAKVKLQPARRSGEESCPGTQLPPHVTFCSFGLWVLDQKHHSHSIVIRALSGATFDKWVTLSCCNPKRNPGTPSS